MTHLIQLISCQIPVQCSGCFHCNACSLEVAISSDEIALDLMALFLGRWLQMASAMETEAAASATELQFATRGTRPTRHHPALQAGDRRLPCSTHPWPGKWCGIIESYGIYMESIWIYMNPYVLDILTAAGTNFLRKFRFPQRRPGSFLAHPSIKTYHMYL